MSKKTIKLMALLLALNLSIAGLAGCKGSSNTGAGANNGKTQFPPEETVTLKYWVSLGSSTGVIDNFNQMGMYKELEKKTNVKIDFTHPIDSQATEQFNIMIASRNFPDIIEGMNLYAGGLTKAYNDKVIVKLNDYMEKYAPNLNKIYQTYPSLLPYIQNEDGGLYCFPQLRSDPTLRQSSGPIIRKDWLEEYNLTVPQTMDELENVLKVFKEKKNLSAPLALSTSDLKSSILTGAYQMKWGFFVEDGVVKFGQYEPVKYKEYLTRLNKWYNDGLLDKEFSTLNLKTIDSKILNSESGFVIGTLGNSLQRYSTLATDPKFQLQPMQYPVINKGESHTYTTLTSMIATRNTAISTSCKNLEIAIQWLDFAYGKEGNLIYNFGVEGESYEMIDGYPTFTSLITDNPDGKAFSTMGRTYARSFSSGPFVQDKRYGEQFFSMPIQKEAISVWGKFSAEADEAGHNFIGTLSQEEISDTTSKLNQIQTFVDENFVKFVMGTTPLDQFDSYLNELKKMGIEDVLKVYQDAQDRFIQKYPDYKIPADTDLGTLFID